MTFALDLAAFAKKTDARTEAIVRRIVLDVAKSLIEMSPVGNKETWAANVERASRGLPALPAGYVGGRFKGSWVFETGGIPTDDPNTIDASGSSSLGRIEAGMGNRMSGNVHYIANNVPYAMALEEGHSRLQAPAGMVMLTTIKFSSIVAEAAAQLK